MNNDDFAEIIMPKERGSNWEGIPILTREEALKHPQPYLVAIDFDECICAGGYPDISKGVLIPSTVEKMKDKVRKISTTVFILWTCRAHGTLYDAKMFVKKHNLPIYLFNEHHHSTFKWMKGATDTRKIYANEYWDDKGVYMGAYSSFEEEQQKRHSLQTD